MTAAYDQIEISGGDTATPLNLEKRIRFIAPFLTPGATTLLDCGCGAGEYVHALHHRYQVDAFGIEYLEAKVRRAKASNPSAERIQQGNIEHIGFPDDTFDVVLLNEVLEHVPSESEALSEVNRVLRPGATLIVFSPNRCFPFETHGVYLKNSDRIVRHYVPCVPYVPLCIGRRIFRYWARNYWPGELRSLLKAHGFEIKRHDFVWQTFENISGNQPLLIRKSMKALRVLSNLLEKTPVLRRFGASQVIVARKSQSALATVTPSRNRSD